MEYLAISGILGLGIVGLCVAIYIVNHNQEKELEEKNQKVKERLYR